MAIKINSEEIATFKENLKLLMPYQDHDLLNSLAKGLYTSSNFTFNKVKGLSTCTAINNVHMYSRHNVMEECRILCSHLSFSRLYHKPVCQDTIDSIEYSLFPNRQPLREKARAEFMEECERNDQILNSTVEQSHLDTSEFPELSQGLIITSSTDKSYTPERDDPPQVTIYGIAAGHVVEYLCSIYPELEINVVILNPEVTAIMLSQEPEMGRRLARKNVHLFLGNDDTEILKNRVVLMPEITLCPTSNSHLKQRLIFTMERNYHSLHQSKKRRSFSALLAQYNYIYSPMAQQLTYDTFGTADDIALVLPGTTLSDSMERIKELMESGIRVMTCLMALPFFEKNKIVPDIVMADDASMFRMLGKLGGRDSIFMKKPDFYRDSTLVFTSKTHLIIPASFSGDKYLAYTRDLQRIGVPVTEGAITDLNFTSSISTAMISLALKMEVQRVYLFGLDTVTRSEGYYSTVTLDDEEVLMGVTSALTDTVECNDGRVRTALHAFTGYKLMIEEIIAKNPHVEFVNCSRFGAIIKGCVLDNILGISKDWSEYNTVM